MIDTKSLQFVIAKTLTDKNVIHSSVKKVGKAPDYFDIHVMDISVNNNTASLEVVMGWQVEGFVYRAASLHQNSIRSAPLDLRGRVLDMAWRNTNTLRLKWFRRVEQALSGWGEEKKLSFTADYEGFEFGAGDGCIWAILPVEVTE